jgi:hypothetical protein
MLIGLTLVAILFATSMVAGDGEARTLLLEDDFTAPDGSDPDIANWTVFTQGAGDVLTIQGNALLATADNGGTSTIITRRPVESREFTLLVKVKGTQLQGWPVMVQVRTLEGTVYGEWFTLFYDSTKGWSFNYRSGGKVSTSYTYSRTLEADDWFSINVTYRLDKVSVEVKDVVTGNSVWSRRNIGTDLLSADNVVSLGVWGLSRQTPVSFFDEFRLWDLQIPPNQPPVWALLPRLEAVEDVLFTFDFSDYVQDIDDPLTVLRLSSESEYYVSSGGLVADFIFPNGVTSASVPMRLHDREAHSDALVQFDVEPVNDPPGHSIPLAQSAVEDIGRTIDLSAYIWDVDSDMGDVGLSSDCPYATVSGLNLTVEFPGSVLTYHLYLNITDGLNTTEALMTFTVLPVDDPPIVLGLTEFEVTEDHASSLDLMPHIQDEDTPTDRLRVSCSSSHVQVVGLNVRFLYKIGGISEDVPMEVTDGNSVTEFSVSVIVIEVNDPPVVTVNRTYMLKENEGQTLFMEPYISDEDNGLDDLSLECDHPAVLGIDGFNITLLYTAWEREHDLRFRVFDGVSKTSGTVRIQVQEINDPPVITGIGGLQPPIVVTVDEGTERWYTIDASDEEQHVLRYTIDSMWLGVMVFQNGTFRVTSHPGEIGSFTGKIFVDDMVGGHASMGFRVDVVNVNDPPSAPLLILPYNHSTAEEGTSVMFRVEVFDPDKTHGQVVTVTWDSNRSGRIGIRSTPEALSFTTDQLPQGDHRITVTASDGEFTRTAWFDLVVLERYVPPPEEEPDPFIQTTAGMSLVILVVVIVLVTVAIAVWMGRRAEERAPVPSEPPPVDKREELEALAGELDAIATALEADRAADTAPSSPPPGTAVPAAAALVPELTEPAPLTAEQEAEREHTKEVREVMKILTQLPRGLPTALWGMDINALAREIVDGPKKVAPDGAPLVQVGGKWYVADVANVGTFLNEVKDEPSRSPVDHDLTEDERKEKLNKLEDALLEGKISEETYQRLQKKYE